MATLNEISATICDALGKPFDGMLKQRVKFSIKYYRAMLIRRDAERNPMSKHNVQRMNVKLKKVDKADTCVVDIDCDVLRTEHKIPKPVRMNSDSPFKYVGTIGGGTSARLTHLEELSLLSYNKVQVKPLAYDWINDYIYIFNNNKLKYLAIEAIFADPDKVADDCSDVVCSDDNTEFPLGDDMIQQIVDGLLGGQLAVLRPNDQEVELEEEAQVVPQDEEGRGGTVNRPRRRRRSTR